MAYTLPQQKFEGSWRTWSAANAHLSNRLWLSSAGEAKEDDDSIWSMEEISDNPGTGRLIGKYIYQRLGAMLERRANRILGSMLVSPVEIGRQIQTRVSFVCRH